MFPAYEGSGSGPLFATMFDGMTPINLKCFPSFCVDQVLNCSVNGAGELMGCHFTLSASFRVFNQHDISGDFN